MGSIEGDKKVKEWKSTRNIAWEVCNPMWKKKKRPETWKTGVRIPLKKKRDGKKVGDYRGG